MEASVLGKFVVDLGGGFEVRCEDDMVDLFGLVLVVEDGADFCGDHEMDGGSWV